MLSTRTHKKIKAPIKAPIEKSTQEKTKSRNILLLHFALSFSLVSLSLFLPSSSLTLQCPQSRKKKWADREPERQECGRGSRVPSRCAAESDSVSEREREGKESGEGGSAHQKSLAPAAETRSGRRRRPAGTCWTEQSTGPPRHLQRGKDGVCAIFLSSGASGKGSLARHTHKHTHRNKHTKHKKRTHSHAQREKRKKKESKRRRRGQRVKRKRGTGR